MSDYGLSAGISAWSTAAMDMKATQYDKKQSELAYARSIENRDYMNQYNSPENQMKRLKSAGLNPNLMYPRGNMGNQPTQSVKYEQPKAHATPKNVQLGGMESYMDLRLKQANISYIDEITRGKEIANDVKTQEQEGGLKYNIKGQEFLNKKQTGENLQKIGEKLGIEKQILGAELTIREFEAELAKAKLNKSDALWARKLYEAWLKWKEKDVEIPTFGPGGDYLNFNR